MKPVVRAALALVVALAVAACGSPSVAEPPTASPTPSAAGAKPGCDLAPASTVNAHLGVVAADPAATVAGPVTVCAYAVGGNARGVIVRFQTGFSHTDFLVGRDGFTKSGQPTSDVAGVGDEAYSSSQAGYSTLVARKATVEILITAKASVDAEQGLMLELLAKV